MDPTLIFDAARKGDAATVRACLDAGADPAAAAGPRAMTALQCAAIGANQAPAADNLAVLRLLVDAGSPLEYAEDSGRTALYLAVEFARDAAPVRLLLAAGAQADVRDRHGNHVVVNARAPEVQTLLSRITGVPVSEPKPAPDVAPLSGASWRKAKAAVDKVFETLWGAGVVSLADAGYTQSDGFSDCVEAFHEAGAAAAGLHGFCFYTRQDIGTAKRTSRLSLAFWGAPEGADPDMLRVGEQIVQAFRAAGFAVAWDGTPGRRPELDLRTLP